MRKLRKFTNGGADDYNVGYRKPPRHTRFKPGQSGNPKGRPKGRRNFETDIKAALKAPVKITQDGVPRKVSTQEAVIMRLKAKALAGDARALDKVVFLAQMYGTDVPEMAASLSGDDEALLEIFRERVMTGAAGPRDPKA